MTEKTMTLAEALSLKKSMKNRIDKRLMKIKLAYLAVNIDTFEQHKEEYDKFNDEMKSTYQSLMVLKTNYDILTGVISIANAKTKTDMLDEAENPYTISQLLSIMSNHIDNDIISAMDMGYSNARSKQAGHKDIVIIDPFGQDLRNKISEDYEAFKEKAEAAIQKANAKKKIKVTFVD